MNVNQWRWTKFKKEKPKKVVVEITGAVCLECGLEKLVFWLGDESVYCSNCNCKFPHWMYHRKELSSAAGEDTGKDHTPQDYIKFRAEIPFVFGIIYPEEHMKEIPF